MLFCCVVVAPLSGAKILGDHVGQKLYNVTLHTLDLPEFSYTNAFARNRIPVITGSMWTISNEFYCYLALALLGLTGLLRRRWVILTAFVCSLVCLELVMLGVGNSGRFAGATTYLVSHVPLFTTYLAGVVFFLFKDKIPHKTSWGIASIVMLAVASRVPHAWHVTFALAATYLVFWFGFHPNIRLRRAAHFGDFSYGVYLYAFPIQQLITLALGSDVNPFLLFFVSTPASLVMAFLSWHGVEKWFLGRTRRQGLDSPMVAVVRQPSEMETSSVELT